MQLMGFPAKALRPPALYGGFFIYEIIYLW